MSRRKFLRTFALGLPVVYAANLPAGILLLAEAGQVDPLPGKDPGLTILKFRSQM